MGLEKEIKKRIDWWLKVKEKMRPGGGRKGRGRR